MQQSWVSPSFKRILKSNYTKQFPLKIVQRKIFQGKFPWHWLSFKVSSHLSTWEEEARKRGRWRFFYLFLKEIKTYFFTYGPEPESSLKHTSNANSIYTNSQHSGALPRAGEGGSTLPFSQTTSKRDPGQGQKRMFMRAFRWETDSHLKDPAKALPRWC